MFIKQQLTQTSLRTQILILKLIVLVSEIPIRVALTLINIHFLRLRKKVRIASDRMRRIGVNMIRWILCTTWLLAPMCDCGWALVLFIVRCHARPSRVTVSQIIQENRLIPQSDSSDSIRLVGVDCWIWGGARGDLHGRCCIIGIDRIFAELRCRWLSIRSGREWNWMVQLRDMQCLLSDWKVIKINYITNCVW